MSSKFKKATKEQAYLRLALEGPAGFGKTFTMLRVGIALAGDKRMALIDTEAGSASKYADLFDFDHVRIDPPFNPDRLTELIGEAVGEGYGAVGIDSLSHFWTGSGGLLEIVDEIARTKHRGDSHAAWREGDRFQQRLVDSILRSPIHVIGAMRTKKDYVREEYEQDGKKKTRIRYAGAKTIQRDEFDYEFDLIGRFDQPAVMAVIKSRAHVIPPETVYVEPGEEFAEILSAWLQEGTPIANRDELEAFRVMIASYAEATGITNEKATTVAGRAAKRDYGKPLEILSPEELGELYAKFTESMKTGAPGSTPMTEPSGPVTSDAEDGSQPASAPANSGEGTGGKEPEPVEAVPVPPAPDDDDGVPA
jgi:hypothetical protein